MDVAAPFWFSVGDRFLEEFVPVLEDPMHSKAFADGATARGGPSGGDLRVREEAGEGAHVTGHVAGRNEGSVDVVRDDLGDATGAGANDGDADGHRLDEDAAERFGLGGRVDQGVEGRNGGNDVRLEGDEVHTVGESVQADEIMEVCLKGGVFVERATNDGEVTGATLLGPLLGDAQEDVLPLPRGEASDDADEGNAFRDLEEGPERALGIALVAVERDSVVDGADGGCGNPFLEQCGAGELGHGREVGLQTAGSGDEGAAHGPAEEVG